MSEAQLSVYTGSEASGILEQVADVYDEVYAEPPYNSGPLFAREEFLQRTDSQLTADGFALITATIDDDIAGFTFGFSWGIAGGAAKPRLYRRKSSKPLCSL